jgi:chlorinating enzyme
MNGRLADEGYLFPLPALSAAEAATHLARLEAFEAAGGNEARGVLRHKGHIVLPWLADLIRHPAIVGPVAEALGPDLLCWTTNAFIKDPGDGHFVSWHQDATYWGLSSNEVLTAWVALTPSTPENGCMRVIPGSHTWPVKPHRDTYDPANLLTRGQEIAVEVDESRAVDITLAPGEMSMHHVLIAHASGLNRSAGRRVGIAIRYIPTRLSQTSGHPDSATLVAGVDRFGHFRPEPRPARDGDPAAMEFYRAAQADATRLLYRAVPAGADGPIE